MNNNILKSPNEIFKGKNAVLDCKVVHVSTMKDGFSVQLFPIFNFFFFFRIVVAMSDLVHDVEAIFHLP